MSPQELKIAIGPELPGHGSWDWVGESCCRILRGAGYQVRTFERQPAVADAYLIIKHPMVTEAMHGKPVLYAPVDRFGSGYEIDAHAEMLFACSTILLHCAELTKYFISYAPVETIEHPLNFTIDDEKNGFRKDGPVLWVGVRSNLKPVVDWLKSGRCREEVWLLSNFENGIVPSQADMGLPHQHPVRIDNWSRAKQIEWLGVCRAAFDVKGEDFRARHKPPAKACDFIASGLPFAIEPGSSPGRYLQNRGYPVVSPNDIESWLTEDYWRTTQKFRTELLRTNQEAAVGRELLRIVNHQLSGVSAAIV